MQVRDAAAGRLEITTAETIPSTSASGRRTLLICVLSIFVVSLAIRLGCVRQARHTPISDAKSYVRCAQHLLKYGEMPKSAYRTPVYPYLLAGLYKYVGNDWRVPALANALIGAVTSALLVLLAAACVDVRTATLAGLIHALSPPTLAYVPQTLTEYPAVLLMIAGLLLVTRVDRRRWWRGVIPAAGSGVLYGLLLLTRPAGLFMLPAWAFLILYDTRGRSWRPMAAAVFLLMTALVITPWLIRNQRLGMGPFMLSSVSGVNLYIGNNDAAVSDGSMVVDVPWHEMKNELGEAGRDRWAREQTMNWILRHPWRYLNLCRVRAMGLLGTKPSGYVVISLGHCFIEPDVFEAYLRRDAEPGNEGLWRQQLGMAQGRVTKAIGLYYALIGPFIWLGLVLAAVSWRRFALPLACSTLYILMISMTFSQPRFREMSDPLLFMLVAALLSDIVFGTRQIAPRVPRLAKTLITAILLIVTITLQLSGLATCWYTLPPM